jgi:predicted metalloendopeptidase
MVSGYLGDALGRLYVERHFPEGSRRRVEDIVSNVVHVYRDAVKAATWLTAGTRAAALAKLVRLDRKIGYPDSWRRYDGLRVEPDDLVGNLQRALRYENQQRLARVGRRTLRGEWLMTPQTVNAYYAPALNEIVFPAAILQPPFFDPAADAAVNYGAIGAVIGHEIGHAFDEQGRLYDAEGRRTNGWPPEDARAYRVRIAPLIDHYARFEPLPGFRVNGRLTLNENAGDLAGLQIAFRAYQRSLDGRPAPVIDGLTGEQRFLMGWAQVWRSVEREGYTRQSILTGLHAPSRFRANGPLSHLDAFYNAFDVHPGDRLYLPPDARVRIW